MKKYIFTILLIGLAFYQPMVFGQIEAASLRFEPTTISVENQAVTSVAVVVDAGGDEITSTDIYVVFDGSSLEAQSVAAGSFFPTVTNNITSGRVYVAGLVDDPATAKTGSGTVATITFKALKQATASLSFDCATSKIIKNDINASNIIDCDQNGTATVTIGSGSSSNSAPPTSDNSGASAGNQLPKSGIVDNLNLWAVSGVILVILGGLAKLFFL